MSNTFVTIFVNLC